VLGELGVTDVGLGGAGRDDQAVVRDARAPSDRVDHHLARAQVEVGELSEDDAGVALLAQDLPGRRRDVSLGQHAGRDLVEQGLEQMMVGAVDDRDIHGR
jgi:hypothetical protein